MIEKTVMTHVAQVRAASLTDYLAVARSVGLNGAAMMAEFGLDPRLLEDPENRLPATAVSSLLAASAHRSGCEGFGLLLARERQFSSLGPLSLLLRHESSLRAVLQRLMAYRGLLTDIFGLELEEGDGESRILVEVSSEAANRQSVELTTALTYRFLGGAIFGGWNPAEVRFRYRAPADPSLHRQIFRAPLRFDADFNGFVLPTEALDRPNASADPGFVEHAHSFVDRLARELPEPLLPDQVGASIKQLLPHGAATLDSVARKLGMNPRTLQRRLAALDLNFVALVADIRERFARDLLADTDIPLSEVSRLLGYATQGSFSRWFTALAGTSPRRWRQRHRSGAA
jgi:AraC-like DNA-binding protein